MSQENKICGKNWFLIWLLGIGGQLCWSVEGSWFNTFVYDKIAPDPAIVAWMVAISATTSTIATFVIGTWGDRIGKRRPFVAAGYIIWGVFTILYGTAEFLPKSPVVLAAVFVVAVDGLMSFFGSVGYHGSFNPWTTDISNEHNRGRLGGALAAVPVIASILSSVGAGALIDAVDYFAFFVFIGMLIVLIGILSLILLRDAPTLRPKRDEKGYWHQLLSIFNWRIVLQNKELFWVFVVSVLYNIAFNVYFPYITIYLTHAVGLTKSLAGIVQGAGLIFAVLLTIPAARFIDRGKTIAVFVIAEVVNLIGLLVVSGAGSESLVVLALGVFGAGLGYVLTVQTLSAWVKNLFPEDTRGQFEGVRMLFGICIPMIIGPAIATAVIKGFGTPGEIDGVTGMIPSGALFVAAAILSLLVFLPLIPVLRIKKEAQADR